MNPKYVFGSDEFGMHMFPRSQWKWGKMGAEEVKSVLKEDKIQYTGDLVIESRSCCEDLGSNVDREIVKHGTRVAE